MKAIVSVTNPTVRRWRRLAENPREARAQGRALAEGLHLAEAALASSLRIDALIVRSGRRSAAVDAIAEAALARGAEGFELPGALYDRISPVEHGAGVLLIVQLPIEAPLERSARDVVYLDGLQDPGNVGTLLRTAAAAGIRSVFTSQETAAVWAPKTLRAGQGAQFSVEIREAVPVESLSKVLDGVWIGADVHDALSLWDAVLPSGAIGWIFGAEGRGLSAAARALCKYRVIIPVDPSAESLNVAAAAAVCLFERRRRATQERRERR